MALGSVVPPGHARVVVKLESANPTGSMKDRVALAMIGGAAAAGTLAPGDTVVEYTAGTTGISLAFVCAALGYRAHFAFSDAFSQDKLHTMRAYGAEITTVPSAQGQITASLIKALIATAAEISRRPGHWYCDQLNNRDGEAGYHALGDELWEQSGARVDALVQASAPRIRSTAPPGRCAVITRHCGSWRSSLPRRRCCPAAPPAPTTSMASGSASFHPCGGRTR